VTDKSLYHAIRWHTADTRVMHHKPSRDDERAGWTYPSNDDRPERNAPADLNHNERQAPTLRARLSFSAFMNSSVDSHGASDAMSSARSLVI